MSPEAGVEASGLPFHWGVLGAVAGSGQMELGTEVPIFKLPSKRSYGRPESIFPNYTL